MDVMNRSRPALPAIAIVALLLAGCGSPPTWQKTGATETVVQNDSDDCRVKARLAPLPERYISSPTSQSMTPQSITAPVLAREEQRAMLEADEFQKCMTAKGYTAKR
jgi:PBP1b-binding outer membrane lipoprotein LpoB